MPDHRVTILCSGVALGVYIPALLLDAQIRELGLDSDVVLLEDLYHVDGQRSLDRLRTAFHDSFELAKMAQRMTRNVHPRLAPERVDSLLRRWRLEDCRDFVVWSGFWMPLLDRYRAESAPQAIHADICRIDAISSPSFAGRNTLAADDREIWFWNWAERRLEHELGVTGAEPVPFTSRADRLVIHGGGWGLGTYRTIADELEALGLGLDRVVDRSPAPGTTPSSSRAFMVEPGWNPWLRETGERPRMPPFAEVTAGVAHGGRFVSGPDCHELYRVIRHAKAIVSKPGGGTLLDSLASATPVVFLDPYGAAEQRNADLWIHLGLGVTWNDWQQSGFDYGLLARLHDNLVRRRGTGIDYSRHVAEGVSRRVAARVGRP